VKRDLFYTLAIAYLVSIFSIPFLINTDLMTKIPFVFEFLFVVFPLLCVFGIFVSYLIGRKVLIFWQLAKFGIVGVFNTIMDFGLLNFLILITGIVSGTWMIVMNATSFSLSIFNSYYWNKEWVFPSRKQARFSTFFVLTLIGLGLNTGIVFVFTTYIPPILNLSPILWANIAKVLATGVSLFWNFGAYKLIVFNENFKGNQLASLRS